MFDGYRTAGVVQKLGYVLSVIEFGLFLNSLSSISIAELEAKEALSDKVRDSHFSLQLLIISVIQFQPDGSPVHVDGREVSASGQWTSRTGNKAARNNVEYFNENRIDPLAVYPELRDVYPKVDFDGQFMGDGFLLYDDIGFFLLMNNDGYHGETWEDGERSLAQREHSLTWFL